jgi:hypothetical protein
MKSTTKVQDAAKRNAATMAMPAADSTVRVMGAEAAGIDAFIFKSLSAVEECDKNVDLVLCE